MRFSRIHSVCGLLALLCPFGLLSAELDLGPALRAHRWIAYAPTGYFPAESPPVLPDARSVAADLRVLRAAGFTGLVTYGSGVEAIAEAAALGFGAMLLGIWDPFDAREVDQALRTVARHSGLITGLVVGNEGLMNGRYNTERLCGAMSALRTAARKPVTSTETVDVILSEPKLVGCSDFITVNAHPYFSNQKSPSSAIQWTLEAWIAVRRQYPDKPLLFKETGLPTAETEGMSEKAQEEFYTGLAKTDVVFAYFEAFDAGPRFKDGLIEQSWGLWRSDRSPKAIARLLRSRHIEK